MNQKGKDLVPPGLRYIAQNIITKQDMFGVPSEQTASWAEGLDLPNSGETVFFAGCGYQYGDQLESMMSLLRMMDKSPIGAELPMSLANLQKEWGLDLAGLYQKIFVKQRSLERQPLRSAARVLSNLGVDFGYLGEDEPCCGALLHFAGLRDKFAENARKTHDNLKSHGVKRIIGIVPSCTYALRDLLSEYLDDYDLEVKHFSQVVAELIGSKELRFPEEAKVTYHDPCQLARYLGITEEPRKVLSAIEGIEFVEPEGTTGEWATCCGGGGGFEVVFPELSEVLAVNRAQELVDTGAQIIVTQCPGCIMQLKHGVKKLGAENVEVLDLAQVIAMAMGV